MNSEKVYIERVVEETVSKFSNKAPIDKTVNLLKVVGVFEMLYILLELEEKLNFNVENLFANEDYWVISLENLTERICEFRYEPV